MQQEIQKTLDEILLQLKQLNRTQKQRDFSFTRLIGAVSQILVIGITFWILVGLADVGNIPAGYETTLKILGAMLLQLVALTFFILDHQDR